MVYPTLFYSQSVNAAQRNYSTYEPEMVAVLKACDAFRDYLLAREFTIRTDKAGPSPLVHSPMRATTRVAQLLRALLLFRFTVNHIKGGENVAADKVSTIPWPVTIPKAVELVQFTGDIELDPEAPKEYDSDSEEEDGEIFPDDSVAQGEVVRLGIEMLLEDQKCDTIARVWHNR